MTKSNQQKQRLNSSVLKTKSSKTKAVNPIVPAAQPPRIAIIMGSDSDLPIMQEAAKALQDFEINYHLEIVSAHRTPEKMFTFAKTAKKNGFQVLIAGAGGAAHLPGMVASLTTLPVIGVPVESKALKGMDSLLSIAQMPKGVPVATMSINGAYNAGLLALRILGIQLPEVQKKLESFCESQKDKVSQMNLDLQKNSLHPKNTRTKKGTI
jgi:5-(carboxyamino)imidazole ribonucleotide mutase